MSASPLLLRNLSCFSFSANTIYTKPYFAISIKAMEARHDRPTTEDTSSATKLDYPKPISAPPPPISKDIELKRAMEASSKSSLFNLTRDHVLYEDEWLMAVNKPKGVYCEAVLRSAPQIVLDSSNEFHLANRLDRDTSGVMLITKSHKVAAKLVKAFTEHKIRKSYIALCIGSSPNWNKITVKSGHGRSKHGAWRVYSALDVGRVLPGGSVVRDMETTFEVVSVNGEKTESLEVENVIVVVESEHELSCDNGDDDDVDLDVGRVLPGGSVVRDMETTFEVVSVNGEKTESLEVENVIVVVEGEHELSCDNGDDDDDDVVVVRAFPRSGRTHQIRLHCQYLGIPIRGDVKYHGMYEWCGRTFEGHELHAECLSLDHPVTDESIVIRAPLPSWAAGDGKC